MVIFVLVGAFQEAFDRLWEAHLLLDVGLPPIAGLGGHRVVRGTPGAATLVLAFALAVPLVSRVERLQAERLARLLLVLHAGLMMSALAFALAGLWLALSAYLATAVIRDLTAAPFSTWLNEAITDSTVRATVLSMTTIAGSLGEWTGGPVLGFVGNRWGVGTALAAGRCCSHDLVFLGRAVRRHGTMGYCPGRSRSRLGGGRSPLRPCMHERPQSVVPGELGRRALAATGHRWSSLEKWA